MLSGLVSIITFESVSPWLVIIPSTILILVWVARYFVPAARFIGQRLYYYYIAPQKLVSRYEHYLVHHFPYFTQLSPKGKARFAYRLYAFLSEKKFIAKGDLELTPEIPVLISAAAIQITFGLKKFMLPHFHTVMVYPESFYSVPGKAYHKGNISMIGIIALSWKDFAQGYAFSHDKINLGLHEMAHALDINRVIGYEDDPGFTGYFDTWIEASMMEFERMNKMESSFIREYGKTNIHEFFAVCVEHFFETPNEFKHRLNNIYLHLCILLNQDPSNWKEDYKFKGMVKS